jgi:hypothetical protein
MNTPRLIEDVDPAAELRTVASRIAELPPITRRPMTRAEQLQENARRLAARILYGLDAGRIDEASYPQKTGTLLGMIRGAEYVADADSLRRARSVDESLPGMADATGSLF